MTTPTKTPTTTTAATTKATPPPEIKIESVADIGPALMAIQQATTERFAGMDAFMLEIAQKSARKGSSGGAGSDLDGDAMTTVLKKSLEDSAELSMVREHRRGASASIDLPPGFFSKAQPLLGAAGGLGAVDRPTSIYGQPLAKLRIRSLIPAQPTTAAAVPYVTGLFINNAAPQVEGMTKAQSDATFALELATCQTLAHFIKASSQVLDDVDGLMAFLDTRMRFGLATVEDNQLLYGTGVGVNLMGLMASATVFATPAEATDLISAIRFAIAALETLGLAPNGIVMNPTSLARAELLKGSDGQFLIGQPLRGNTAPTLWGVPVVSSAGIAETEFLTGDFGQAATIYDRMAARVDIGFVDDDFVKNMVTIRCEERLALATHSPSALLKGTIAP